MEIILLEKIRNLGALGEVVNVKAGFARNYLLPQGKAVSATADNKARFEAERAELEKRQQGQLAAAQARAEKLAGMTVQIARKIGDEGKLFGSVTLKDVVDAMKASGVELSRSEVHLPEGPLKEIGDHKIQVTLHPEVNLTVTVSVVAEK
ncbi:MAG: 50S ribosomal protein L9 [Pseudomonadota bacterium]